MDLPKLCMNQLRRITFSKSSFIPKQAHCTARLLKTQLGQSLCCKQSSPWGTAFQVASEKRAQFTSYPLGDSQLKCELRKTALNITENERISHTFCQSVWLYLICYRMHVCAGEPLVLAGGRFYLH